MDGKPQWTLAWLSCLAHRPNQLTLSLGICYVPHHSESPYPRRPMLAKNEVCRDSPGIIVLHPFSCEECPGLDGLYPLWSPQRRQPFYYPSWWDGEGLVPTAAIQRHPIREAPILPTRPCHQWMAGGLSPQDSSFPTPEFTVV